MISKKSKELLEDLQGQEIRTSIYETQYGVVGISGDKVTESGIVLDTLNTPAKIKALWDELIFNELGIRKSKIKGR